MRSPRFLPRTVVLLVMVFLAVDTAAESELSPHHYLPFSSDPSSFTGLGSWVFFTASTSDAGRELWRTDGTSLGTELFMDIVPGLEGSDPSNLVLFRDALYFSATNPGGGGDLWRSDGTRGGTQIVKRFSLPLHHFKFVVAGRSLFLVPDGLAVGNLWRSDGTADGTISLRAISGVSDAVALGDSIMFAARDLIVGRELWVSDGTVTGTRIIADLVPGYTDSSPRGLTTVGDSVFFSADNRLWRSQGTAQGTALVADFFLQHSVAFEGALYFNRGSELWKSDGTASGTNIVRALPSWLL
ncbi:MAG: hypothetical protein KY432_09940, partial [Acidobacteria bacterium]|nr:hypothetical protein [Acidobacteriota bacterium]